MFGHALMGATGPQRKMMGQQPMNRGGLGPSMGTPFFNPNRYQPQYGNNPNAGARPPVPIQGGKGPMMGGNPNMMPPQQMPRMGGGRMLPQNGGVAFNGYAPNGPMMHDMRVRGPNEQQSQLPPWLQHGGGLGPSQFPGMRYGVDYVT